MGNNGVNRLPSLRNVVRNSRFAFSNQYRATSTGRTRWSRSGQSGTGDDLLSSSDLASLREQHRDFDRNNCIFEGILNRWVDNVVGPGFTFQMKTDDEVLNMAIEERMAEWAASEADYRGILTLWEMQRLLLREIGTGGDMGFVKVAGSLQPIEPDLLVTPSGKSGIDGIYHGVEVDTKGRPKKYHLGQWGPYGFVDTSQTSPIDPKYFIHVFQTKRLSQHRGVPILTGALELFERLDDYVEATLVAAQVGACQSAVITTDAGAGLGEAIMAETETAADNEDMPTREMEPGMMWFLKPGENVQTVNPAQPTGEFEPFIATLLRFTGLTLGMPLELVLLDYSKTNYSSAKAAMTQAAITFRAWQKLLQIRFLNPLTAWKLPRFYADIGAKYDPEMAQFVWVPPGWKWIDPPREAQAHIDAASVGVETMEQVAAEQGRFWKDISLQRAREIEFANEIAEKLGDDVTWRDIIPAREESNNGGSEDFAGAEGGPAVQQP